MKQQSFWINLTAIIILIIIITVYSINIKKQYPEWALDLASEPIYLFILYMVIFGVSYYNALVALLLLIVVVSLHLDFKNLVEISLQKVR